MATRSEARGACSSREAAAAVADGVRASRDLPRRTAAAVAGAAVPVRVTGPMGTSLMQLEWAQLLPG